MNKSIIDNCYNAICYLSCILEYVNRWNTQGVDAMFSQPLVPRYVMNGGNVGVMGFTVNFDSKVGARAEEIEHIWSGWMLLTEFVA